MRNLFSKEVFVKLGLPNARLNLPSLSFMMGALIARTTFVQASNGDSVQYGERQISSDDRVKDETMVIDSPDRAGVTGSLGHLKMYQVVRAPPSSSIR